MKRRVRQLMWIGGGVIALLGAAALGVQLRAPRSSRSALSSEPRDPAPRLAGTDAGERAALLAGVERAPGDGASWLRLAEFDRTHGLSPDVYIAEARRAVSADPTLGGAWLIVAEESLSRGAIVPAVEALESACRTARDGDRAFLMLGELLLRGDPAEPRRARRALEQGGAALSADGGVKLLLAEAWLREVGEIPAAEQPEAMHGALVRAGRCFDGDRKVSAPAPTLSSAWVALVTRHFEAALADAEAVLASTSRTSDGRIALLRLIRTRALFALGRSQDAVASIRSMLHAEAAWAEVADVVGLDGLPTDDAVRQSLIAPEQFAKDAHGALHAVRAYWAIESGRMNEADEWALTAAQTDPGNGAFQLLVADVSRARGDRAAAIAAYGQAQRLLPNDPAPLVGRAFALADPRCGGPAGTDACDAALAELETLAGDEVLAAQAALHFALGRRVRATELLAACTSASQLSADAWRRAADAYAISPLAEHQERAATCLARARALRPGDVQLACGEARARLACGDPEAARRLCDRVLEVRENCIAVLAIRAQAASELRSWHDAARDFRTVAEATPDDASAALRCVESLYRAREPEAARRFAAERMEAFSSDARHRLEVLRASLDGDAESADLPGPVSAEVRLREGDAEDCARLVRALVASGSADARSLSLLALCLGELADPTPALAELSRAMELTAASLSPPCRALIEGCIELASGRAEGATVRLTAALAAFPADPLVRRKLACALESCGRREEALREFRTAASAVAASDSLRREVAARLQALARAAPASEEAESFLADARRLDPSNLQAVDDLCVVLQRLGRADQAARVAEEQSSVATDPWRTRFILRACLARITSGDVRRAAELVASLDTAALSSSEALTIRGVIELRSGRVAESRELLERARKEDPDNQVAFAACVEAALAAGDVARVRQLAEERSAISRTWIALSLAAHGHLPDGRAIAEAALAESPGDLGCARAAVALEGRGGAAGAAVAMARRFADSVPASRGTGARLLLGEALGQFAGAHAEARAIAEEVLSGPLATPEQTLSAKVLLAEARLGLGDTAAASDLAAQLLANISSAGVDGGGSLESRCRFVLGSAAFLRSDSSLAETELARCLANDPGHAAAANNLAWILSKSAKDARRALDLARRATSTSPSNPGFWDTRAVCAVAAGESREAEESWRRALTGHTAPSPARTQTGRRLASFLRAAGRRDEAQTVEDAVR